MDAFHNIPYETNLIWVSYLSPKEIGVISQVSKYWNELSKDNSVWKYWWKSHFCENKTNNENENKNSEEGEEEGLALAYQKMYKEFGKYISSYGRIRRAWNIIEKWLKDHSPATYASLEPGLSQKDIDEATCSAQRELPLDILCSMRMHNGQREDDEDTFGLFGACSAYDYAVNMRVLRLQDIHVPHSNTWLANVVMIVRSSLNDYIYFVVVNDFTDGNFHYKRGMIVDHTTNYRRPVFLANSFTELLEKYAEDLHRGRYDVFSKKILMIPALASDGSDVTTHGVRVRANAIYMPQRSNFNLDALGNRTSCSYFFIYRIRISMSKDEDPSNACILRTRHWRITDESGTLLDAVDGAGVIGWYPRAFPGSYFEYCSCTNQAPPKTFMGGFFTFANEAKGEITVTIGQFPLFAR